MSNPLHVELARLVEKRHPRGDLTPVQLLRLRMLKLLEESIETATSISLPSRLSATLDETGKVARGLFRERGWLKAGWTPLTPPGQALDALKEELADVYIVIALTEQLLEEITGEPFDIKKAALAKARSDLARGKVDYHAEP